MPELDEESKIKYTLGGMRNNQLLIDHLFCFLKNKNCSIVETEESFIYKIQTEKFYTDEICVDKEEAIGIHKRNLHKGFSNWKEVTIYFENTQMSIITNEEIPFDLPATNCEKDSEEYHRLALGLDEDIIDSYTTLKPGKFESILFTKALILTGILLSISLLVSGIIFNSIVAGISSIILFIIYLSYASGDRYIVVTQNNLILYRRNGVYIEQKLKKPIDEVSLEYDDSQIPRWGHIKIVGMMASDIGIDLAVKDAEDATNKITAMKI